VERWRHQVIRSTYGISKFANSDQVARIMSNIGSFLTETSMLIFQSNDNANIFVAQGIPVASGMNFSVRTTTRSTINMSRLTKA